MREIVKKLGGSLLKLIALYIAVLAVAAFLTPWVAEFVKTHWPKIGEAKVFDRLRAVGLVLALPLLWKWAGLKRWGELGWKNWRAGAMLMLAGAASVCGLGMFLAQGVQGGVEYTPYTWQEMAGLCVKGLAVAMVVALLEETVFRGIFQRILVKSGGLWLGVIFTAAIFAWLHARPEAAGNSWELAWRYISTWPNNFPVMMWVNLALFGAALGFLYERGKSLWWPISFHAGMVAAMIPMSALLHRIDPSLNKLFLMTHPLTTVVLGLWAAGAAVIKLNGRQPKV